MVFPSLESCRSPPGNNSNDFALHCVGDKPKASFSHANDGKAVLAAVLALVEQSSAKGSLKTSRAASKVTP
jgi:hypothetical protein